MRKILILLVAFLLPLSGHVICADEKPPTIKISLRNEDPDKKVRSLQTGSIESYYYGLMNCIVTTTLQDMGDVSLTVVNTSTGSVWYDTFDSALEPQTVLPLSGEPGIYQIVYITESGDIYQGTFNLN